jgi:hypothetical protein
MQSLLLLDWSLLPASRALTILTYSQNSGFDLYLFSTFAI